MKIGDALRKYRDDKKMTLEEISEKTGIPASTISTWERGANAPRQSNIESLLDFYDVDYEEFEEDTEPVGLLGLRWVPIVSYAQAGTIAADYQDLCNQIDEKVPTDSKDANCFAVHLIGDSMEPNYFAGDIVICNPNQMPTNGTLALARLKTGETLFKWWFTHGDLGRQVKLGSDNQVKYPAKLYDAKDFDWAYRVHTVIKQNQTRRSMDFPLDEVRK